MSNFTKIIDRGFKNARREIDRLRYAKIKVGYLASSGDHPGSGDAKKNKSISLARLASIHENGTDNGRIPPRPFMGIAFDENLEKFSAYIVRGIKNFVIAGSAKQLVRRTGELYVNSVKRTIGSDKLKPNAQRTKDLKGSDRPLIHKGILKKGLQMQAYPAYFSF
jgi:hypothetical protein